MASKHPSWNSGRAIGPKSAFTPEQVLELIRIFRTGKRWHDLALLTTGIDTMLRSSDLLRLQVRDVSDLQGQIRTSFYWRQQKAGRNVRVGLSEAARRTLQRWIEASGKAGADYLFTRTKGRGESPICYTTYCRAVKSWARALGLDPAEFSSHSLRRTKPKFLYDAGCAVPDISRMLGHKSPEVTLVYLGITDAHILEQSLRYDIFTGHREPESRPQGQGSSAGLLLEDAFLEKLSSMLAAKMKRHDR